jgi:hypothetical protein
VLFEHGDGKAGPCQQQAEHDPGWTPADNAGRLHGETLTFIQRQQRANHVVRQGQPP